MHRPYYYDTSYYMYVLPNSILFNTDVMYEIKDGNSSTQVIGASGVVSLSMHPDKYKTQLLALALDPSALRVYNTATYKVCSMYFMYCTVR